MCPCRGTSLCSDKLTSCHARLGRHVNILVGVARAVAERGLSGPMHDRRLLQMDTSKRYF